MDNRDDELKHLKEQYETELSVWRNKFSQTEVEKENIQNFEKVQFHKPAVSDF